MTRRHGMALPAVLFAIALTSALVVGGLYAVRTLVLSGRSALIAWSVDGSLEHGLLSAAADQDSATWLAQPVGTTIERPEQGIDGVSVASWVTRTSENTWWLVAEGTAGTHPRVRRRLGLIVHRFQGETRPVSGPAWVAVP